jgi:hypothetical protein
MKRTVIGVILIVTAVLTSVAGCLDMTATSKRIINQLNTAKAYCNAGDYESCRKSAEIAVEDWIKAERRYKVYLNHEELDELELCFDMLKEKLGKENDKEEKYCDLLNEGIFRLRHIINSQKPKPSEIF